MSKGKCADTTPALIEAETRRAREMNDDVHPGPLTAPLQEMARIVPHAPAAGEAAARLAPGGVIVIDLGENMDVTAQYLCKVPVSSDVLHCGCGGVLSQRFNESYFCRSCGKEESR